MVRLSIVRKGVRCAWGPKSGIVLDPIIRVPGGPRLVIVPSTVCAAPPGELVEALLDLALQSGQLSSSSSEK